MVSAIGFDFIGAIVSVIGKVGSSEGRCDSNESIP